MVMELVQERLQEKKFENKSMSIVHEKLIQFPVFHKSLQLASEWYI